MTITLMADGLQLYSKRNKNKMRSYLFLPAVNCSCTSRDNGTLNSEEIKSLAVIEICLSVGIRYCIWLVSQPVCQSISPSVSPRKFCWMSNVLKIHSNLVERHRVNQKVFLGL